MKTAPTDCGRSTKKSIANNDDMKKYVQRPAEADVDITTEALQRYEQIVFVPQLSS